ncbi:hypothetical protein Ancab_001169 [Ancistrocladus abbreviatus]
MSMIPQVRSSPYTSIDEHVVGLNQDINLLVLKLTTKENQASSTCDILAIVGMGGSGKTFGFGGLPVRPPARDSFYLYLEVGVVNETATAVFSERVMKLQFEASTTLFLEAIYTQWEVNKPIRERCLKEKLLKHHTFFSHSFEGVIICKGSVLKALIKEKWTLSFVFLTLEKYFLKRFVAGYHDSITELLSVYRGQVDPLDKRFSEGHDQSLKSALLV